MDLQHVDLKDELSFGGDEGSPPAVGVPLVEGELGIGGEQVGLHQALFVSAVE
ncbi:hypothetical protein ACIF8T_39960 [Streptomyces sp. NPDC085946]|uniref:hypothetical protein n=1 Tax=Streptomyces sp. NPDC085946 TaxID=3365744 RepID=UPI0037D1A2B9